jgi:hypothetical protein
MRSQCSGDIQGMPYQQEEGYDRSSQGDSCKSLHIIVAWVDGYICQFIFIIGCWMRLTHGKDAHLYVWMVLSVLVKMVAGWD